MATVEQITKALIVGDPRLPRQEGIGPAKLTETVAAALRPRDVEMQRCESVTREGTDTAVCAVIDSLSLSQIETHAAGKRNIADKARRTICLVQRSCKVASHMSDKERIIFACAKVKEELEDFLGKT
jgi:hypothetical protein